jgi:glycosyltransferase involved in cell wall biosynthesis
VEALHSGLPILVSNRIGNYPEALREGENGWGLDPMDPESVRAAARAAFGSSPEQRAAMGERSREIGVGHWSSRPAVERFLDQVPVESAGGERARA